MAPDLVSNRRFMSLSIHPALRSHFRKAISGLAVFLFLFCQTTLLHAQVATGDILGTVLDSTASSIPGASVRLENIGTHEVRTFVTSGDGGYVFSALQPGTYSVTITSPSFKTFVEKNVVLAAADRVRVNASLQVGGTQEQVEVTATPSSLQTDDASVGSTITEKTLLDAPTIGRNYISLIQVQAGINAGSPGSLSSGSAPTDRRLPSGVSANGQEELFNNSQLDGLDNNSRALGTPMLRPSVEAIAETRTTTNLYPAEVGRTGGAAIDVITKSGENGFHGSLYEFFRNDITDARNFFISAPLRKPEVRRNQFGGSFSGPIRRDKTFFFVDYENLRSIDGNNSVYTSTVPTLYEQQHPGDLSDTGGPVIPTANLNATTLAYFKLFPTPNAPGTFNNFVYNPSATLYQQLGDVRIDHHFSANDTLFGRYSYNRTAAFTPPYLPNANGVAAGGNLAGAGSGNNITITHNGQFGYTHIFTPSLLLELRTGYTYFDLDSEALNAGRNLNDTAPYLIPNANECGVCSGLAPIQVVGYAALGDTVALPTVNYEHTTQFAGAVTYTHGRNNFKFGSALIRRNFTYANSLFPKGLYIFPSLANFLAGTPYLSNRIAFLIKPYERSWEPSVYVQDNWRATNHLTFNLGLRYDVFTKPSEKNGNYSNFDIQSLSIIKNNTGGIQNTYNDISPRFGFDASFGQGMVLRGGFGLTFYPSDAVVSTVISNPGVSINTGFIFNPTIISQTGVVPAVQQSTATSALTGTVTSKPLSQSDSYFEQFNLLFQKEYRGTVLTVGYVGELGRHIGNQIPNLDLPAPTGPVPAGTPPPALVYSARLPKVNTIDRFENTGESSYNSLQVSVERRVSKGLTANINYTYAHNLDDVYHEYDGDGLVTTVFGEEPQNVSRYDYGNSPLDVRSRIAGFFTYDLPFGHGDSKLYRAVAGGFRLNGLGFWQTGNPFTIISSALSSNGLATINLPTVTSDKPNVVAPIRTTGSVTGQYFSLNSFAQQPLGTAGNEGRNQVFGPHLRRGDLSLFKTIPLHDKASLELRAECFNFTNTPNFAPPNNVITAYATSATPAAAAAGGSLATNAGGFGTTTGTVFGFSGRQYQFAARFSF